MQNGLIHDVQINASSNESHSTSPQLGRLNGPASWLPAVDDSDRWFQVDFIAKVFVDEVQTQGHGRSDFFVQTYKLLYGDDGYIFTEYGEDISGPKVCTLICLKAGQQDFETEMDHSPIIQTFNFENNFSTVGKSFLNLVKL